MNCIKFTKGSFKKVDIAALRPSNTQSVIKVLYCGLCGSDVHRIKSADDIKEGSCFGHEIVGEIVKTQSEYFLKGDKVCISPILPCLKCLNCKAGLTNLCGKEKAIGKNLQGGFASHVKIFNSNIYKIADDSLELRKYVFVDSLACVVHSVNLINKNLKGKNICIVGDGAIAELTARYCTFLKAREIIIIGKDLLSHTKYKSYRYDDKDIAKYKDNFDVVFDCVGGNSEYAFSQASTLLRNFGALIILAVYQPNIKIIFVPRNYFAKEIKIYGSRSYVVNKKIDEFRIALNLIAGGRLFVDDIITHMVSMGSFNSGIKMIKNKNRFKCKKIVFYN